MLNELVAIGYGSQKRANLTGAVATVDVARTMDSRPATVGIAYAHAVLHGGLLGGDENHTESCARTVDGAGSGILEHAGPRERKLYQQLRLGPCNSAPRIPASGAEPRDRSRRYPYRR